MQRRCKFGLDCMFVHIVEQNVDERMDDKVKQLENEIKNKTEEINEQNNKICELESKLEKFLDMNQQMNEKNDFIESLQKRIDMMEERMIKIVDDKESKLDKLINKTSQLEEKVVDLEDALIVTENSRAEESQSQLEQTFLNPYSAFKCDLCDFSARCDENLNLHKQEKQKETEIKFQMYAVVESDFNPMEVRKVVIDNLDKNDAIEKVVSVFISNRSRLVYDADRKLLTEADIILNTKVANKFDENNFRQAGAELCQAQIKLC